VTPEAQSRAVLTGGTSLLSLSAWSADPTAVQTRH